MKKTRERICVGAVLLRERGHRRDKPPLVLLGRRAAGRVFYPDVWDVPGGHLEPGETSRRLSVSSGRRRA